MGVNLLSLRWISMVRVKRLLDKALSVVASTEENKKLLPSVPSFQNFDKELFTGNKERPNPTVPKFILADMPDDSDTAAFQVSSSSAELQLKRKTFKFSGGDTEQAIIIAPDASQPEPQQNSRMDTSIMDTSSPYYIHYSDHPDNSLVPIKLNGINYSSWSKSMIIGLRARNKNGFVDGSIQPPSETEQPKEYALWNRCNNMILSWLANSVEPNLVEVIIQAKTAHQVWVDFKNQFSQNNALTIYQIQKSIASLSQGNMTVSDYFTKLKGLWGELERYRSRPTCNQMKAHSEQIIEDRVMQFLMGLKDTYNGVRSNILMMTPLPNVLEAYVLVIQDEAQQMTSNLTENFSIAVAVQNRSSFSDNSKNKHCGHCDRVGHTIENCRSLKFHCKFCDGRGHTEERCKFKNRTLISNGTGTETHRQNQKPQKRGTGKEKQHDLFPTANATVSFSSPSKSSHAP